MSTSFKIDLVIIIIAFVGILVVANYKPNPAPPVPAEVMEEVDAAIDSPGRVSFIPPEDTLTFDDTLSGFGLTIRAGDPCSLDLEEVSCADAVAIVKYRKALNDIEIKKLQDDIEQLEQERLEDDYGIVEC